MSTIFSPLSSLSFLQDKVIDEELQLARYALRNARVSRLEKKGEMSKKEHKELIPVSSAVK